MSDIKVFLDSLIDQTASLRDKLESRIQVLESPAVDASGNVTFTGDVFALGLAKGLQEQFNDINDHFSSSNLPLTVAYQDVPGCTTGVFTPLGNEYAYCMITASISLSGGTAPTQVGDSIDAPIDLVYASTDHMQAGAPLYVVSGTAAIGTAVTAGLVNLFTTLKLPLTAGTAYEIKMQARNATGARGQFGGRTHLMVWRVAR